jgi:hypothetical protein
MRARGVAINADFAMLLFVRTVGLAVAALAQHVVIA